MGDDLVDRFSREGAVLCILYVTVVGALLGVVGLLVEQMLPNGFPRRWLWCLLMPISVVLPGVYRMQHNWAITSSTASAGRSPMDHPAAGALSGMVDPALWARIEAWDPAINRIWGIASWTLLAWGVVSALRILLVLYASRARRGAIVDGVPVVVTETAGPATVGVLRSRVLVPRWVLALPALQRRYVLRHEEEHRRAHDAQLLFVASLALVLMPWNVAMWWQLRRLCLAVEMDCDARVVSALGDAHAYGNLLLKVAEAETRGLRLQPAFLGVGSLERRLRRLVAPTSLRRSQRFLLPALVLALLLLVVVMPHPILTHESHTHATAVR